VHSLLLPSFGGEGWDVGGSEKSGVIAKSFFSHMEFVALMDFYFVTPTSFSLPRQGGGRKRCKLVGEEIPKAISLRLFKKIERTIK